MIPTNGARPTNARPRRGRMSYPEQRVRWEMPRASTADFCVDILLRHPYPVSARRRASDGSDTGRTYRLGDKEPTMSLQSIASEFVDLCNQGRNFDVMRTMYAPNIVSVEGDGAQT